jgi:periplasmic copper chaperone A
MRTWSLLAVPLLAAALLAADGQPGIKVVGAWVRPTPPGADTAAVYALIRNDGAAPDRLLSAETDAAKAAQVHEMKMENGMMVMREVPGGLEVPAHGALHLQPGGYHVMLIDLKHQIKAGERIRVTLVFEHAGRVALRVLAREPGRRQGGKGRGQAMPPMKGMGAGQGKSN